MIENYDETNEFKPIIDDDEQIIWDGKPLLIPFLLNAAPVLLLGLGWLFMVGIMMPISNEDAFTVPGASTDNPFMMMFTLIRFLPLLLGIGQVIYLMFVYKNTHYAITNKRLLFKSGLFGIDYKIVDYDQIKNMEVNVNPFEKLLEAGSIRIFNGEMITHNQTTRAVPTTMSAITDPYEVFKKLKKISVDIKTDWNYPNQYRPDDNQGYSTRYKK
jgi:hypothetical protein